MIAIGKNYLKLLTSIFLLLILLTMTTVAPLSASPTRQSSIGELVWSDEFEGPANTAIEGANWNIQIGDGCAQGICGWGNQELEYYTDSLDNISLDGQGHLRIVARSAAGSGLICYYNPCLYTSARITTKLKHEFQYGRIEARIQLPTGQGLWPAFWMLGKSHPSIPWPRSGEIDIMENKGSQPNITSSAVHGPTNFSPYHYFIAQEFEFPPTQAVTNFHVYAVEWKKDQIRFYVDDNLYQTVSPNNLPASGTWIFNQSFYILLNLAVGGMFDGNPPTNPNYIPATMLVDYVRVYQSTSPTAAPSRIVYTTASPVLTWNTVSWAINYEVEVDSLASFTAPLRYSAIMPAPQVSTTVTPALSYGRYYWRVRAQQSNGSWGLWSAAQSFLVDPP
jgi:beta-glucanase (GH16 family)